jgi:CBS domain-containing protein
MKTRDRMVKTVSVCRPDDNLAHVTATMWEDRLGALPVVDEKGRAMSMITDRDICIALGTRNLRAAEVQVKDVAMPRIFTCLDTDEVNQALLTMVSQNIRRLPVVNEDAKLVGVLSIDDFLMHTEPGKAGVLSLEAIEALKAIVENRKRGHEYAPTALAATHG